MTVLLFKARDATDSFALACAGDPQGSWRAQSGFGSDFAREWTVELQSREAPAAGGVDWNAVLARVVEAAEMSDPVIADYAWPTRSS